MGSSIRNLSWIEEHFKYETAGSSNFGEEKHMAYKPQQWKVSKCLCNMVEEISSLQIQFPSCQYDGRKAKYMIQAVMVSD